MSWEDEEPIFKQSRWGGRYQLNPANPVGAVLILVILVFTAVVLYLMANHIGPFAIPDPDPTSTYTPGQWGGALPLKSGS